MKICVIGFNHISVKILDIYKTAVCITKNMNSKEYEDIYNFVYDDYTNLDKEFYSKFDTVIMTTYDYNDHISNLDKFSKLIKLISTQKFIYMSSAVVYIDVNMNKILYYDEKYKRYNTTEYSIVKNKIDELVDNQDNMNKKIIGLCLGTVSGKSIINREKRSIINQIMYDYINNKQVYISNNLYKSIITIYDLVRVINTVIDNGKINRGYYNISSFEINTDILQDELKKLNIEYTVKDIKCKYNFYLDNKKFKADFKFEFLDDLNSHIKSFI